MALPAQLSALDACVNAVDVVTPSVLTKVLQTLAVQTPRPPLMMRTAMLGCKLHEKLKASVVGLLSELVRGQAWKEEKLWAGVVRCCEVRAALAALHCGPGPSRPRARRCWASAPTTYCCRCPVPRSCKGRWRSRRA